ncbi:unnamed protein product [Victoria cruziana]
MLWQPFGKQRNECANRA